MSNYYEYIQLLRVRGLFGPLLNVGQETTASSFFQFALLKFPLLFALRAFIALVAPMTQLTLGRGEVNGSPDRLVSFLAIRESGSQKLKQRS